MIWHETDEKNYRISNRRCQYLTKILQKTSMKLFRLLPNSPRYLDADEIIVSKKIKYISAIFTGLSTMANHPEKT